MITALSTSLTLSAQGIVQSDVALQIFNVGNTAPTEGYIRLIKDTDYTKTSTSGPKGNGYEQFNGVTSPTEPNNIELTLQSTADMDATLVFEFRQRADNTMSVEITVGSTITKFENLNESSQYYVPTANVFRSFLLPTGATSFTNGVTKNIKVDLLTSGGSGESDQHQRRFYNVQVTNTALLSTNNFITKNEIKLYPNPSTDSFELNSKIDVNNVKIFNITGQLVKTLESVTNKYDISDLKSGLYLATINTNSGSGTVKLIKQ